MYYLKNEKFSKFKSKTKLSLTFKKLTILNSQHNKHTNIDNIYSLTNLTYIHIS